MSDEKESASGDPEGDIYKHANADEDLTEAAKPSDPELSAVEKFDQGLDTVVAGVKSMEEAAAVLRGEKPEMEQICEGVEKGLLPWIEKLDGDFVTLYPEMDEESKK